LPSRGVVSARAALSPTGALGFAASARTATPGVARPHPPTARPVVAREVTVPTRFVGSSSARSPGWRADGTVHLLALVCALVIFAVVVFVAVVIGIHSERHHREMTTKPQGLVGAMVRRLLGVYVGKPVDTVADDREECLTGQATDWWDKGGGNR
jgi:hypothetical protein